MTVATLNVLPEEQALADAGISPSGMRLYIRDAFYHCFYQNLIDELKGYLEYDSEWDEFTEKGVDARQLIIDYVKATLLIDFEGAVL